MKIPKEMCEIYRDIEEILTEYSEQYLDSEYKELCLHALEKLCRKRPSPLKTGHRNIWAAGIIYAVGRNNFIFDKNQPIHMTAKELAAPLGVSASTASAKGADITRMLKINYFNSEWCLPSRMDSNPMLWMVEINGLPVDARRLPPDIQKICYANSLIPYVYAERHSNGEKTE